MCWVAAIACGGSGCIVWLSTTFANGVKAIDNTTTAAIQAAMTSQGPRTTMRPNREKPSKPFAVLAVVAFFNTVNSSRLFANYCARQRDYLRAANRAKCALFSETEVTAPLARCRACQRYS